MNRRNNTVIELVVVIGIVAVLAAMLFPAMNQARLRAQNAGCLANLKQFGQAGSAYAADNADMTAIHVTTDNYRYSRDKFTTGRATWQHFLSGYLGVGIEVFAGPYDWDNAGKHVFRCPAVPVDQNDPNAYWGFPGTSDTGANRFCYTMNLIGYGTRIDGTASKSGANRVKKLKNINDPSAMFAVVEGTHGGGLPDISNIDNGNETIPKVDNGANNIRYPHGDLSSNQLYADGHTESYKGQLMHFDAASTNQEWSKKWGWPGWDLWNK